MPAVYLKLFRIKDWVKNLFIFIPAFFGSRIEKIWSSANLFLSFCCFCCIASAVYIINDIRDLEYDRRHPVKKYRPLPAGKIRGDVAALLAVVLTAVALLLSFYIGMHAFWVILVYFVLNIGYSFGLKNIPLLDITIISMGFLLRVFMGGMVIDLKVSKWLALMVFLLSLILALGKRRDDLLINGTGAGNATVRESIHGYNIKFIDASILSLSMISMVCYILYTVSSDVDIRLKTEYFYLTAIPVILGFLRYLQMIFVFENTGSPTSLFLKDRALQWIILLWVLSSFLFIYAS